MLLLARFASCWVVNLRATFSPLFLPYGSLQSDIMLQKSQQDSWMETTVLGNLNSKNNFPSPRPYSVDHEQVTSPSQVGVVGDEDP